MATLRDIKARIQGVTNTQQITKAMKMVAAARLRRAQENIISARPYARKQEELLTDLLLAEKDYNHPLLEVREIKRIAVVLVTSDRGLCGGFNMNVIRKTEDLIKNDFGDLVKDGDLDLYCIGKKGYDYFKSRDMAIYGEHLGIFSDLNFDFAANFISHLVNRYRKAEIDKVFIIFNEFKSVVQQNIIQKQLFPVKPIVGNGVVDVKGTEYIYEPDKIEIINSMLPRYLNTQMWTILLDSYAAELGARMTAMDMATENAKDLIKSLQVTYNKERQAAITNEILEIVSGANALQDA